MAYLYNGQKHFGIISIVPGVNPVQSFTYWSGNSSNQYNKYQYTDARVRRSIRKFIQKARKG